MILNISPLKSFLASVLSALAGTSFDYVPQLSANVTLSAANTAFQHAAWSVAILAGLVSIVNGIIRICKSYKNRISEKNKIKQQTKKATK